MAIPTRRFKWLTVVWVLVIGAGLIALAGSILLPSTKRARVDWGELRRLREQDELAAAAATQPATAPAAAAPAADDSAAE